MAIRSVRSLVENQTPLTGARTTTVLEAAHQMKAHGKGALLVVEGSKLIGIFTERDALFRVIAAGRDPATTALADVMTPQPQTIHPDEPFLNAMRIMHRGGFRHLPVVGARPAARDGFGARRARRRPLRAVGQPRATRADARVAPAQRPSTPRTLRRRPRRRRRPAAYHGPRSDPRKDACRSLIADVSCCRSRCASSPGPRTRPIRRRCCGSPRPTSTRSMRRRTPTTRRSRS